ncbi:hypothetical protein tb265_50320 [Gemmatimonadetes bacterium T265]|nr:hypothetical protein tb265_50320 [Gemmatimonadetes bacterium T265]
MPPVSPRRPAAARPPPEQARGPAREPARPPRRNRFPSPTRAPEYQYMLGELRAAREALGLTQGEVGRRLGRGDQFVSKCETGDRRMDPIDLLRFAQLYGRPVVSFLPTLPDHGDARAGPRPRAPAAR